MFQLMPRSSGIEYVDRSKRCDAPGLSVVSVTANYEHAAVAYKNPKMTELSGPPSKREPADLTFRHTATPAEVLQHFQMLASRQPARIAIKAKEKVLLINLADIISVEAKHNHVLLKHMSSSHPLRESITESISTMEKRLSPYGFVRIHRSVLVNAAFVEEIHPWSTGEYVLRLRGGGEYTVTRTYKKNLHLLAESWIGTDGFAADE